MQGAELAFIDDVVGEIPYVGDVVSDLGFPSLIRRSSPCQQLKVCS